MWVIDGIESMLKEARGQRAFQFLNFSLIRQPLIRFLSPTISFIHSAGCHSHNLFIHWDYWERFSHSKISSNIKQKRALEYICIKPCVQIQQQTNCPQIFRGERAQILCWLDRLGRGQLAQQWKHIEAKSAEAEDQTSSENRQIEGNWDIRGKKWGSAPEPAWLKRGQANHGS